MSNLKRYVWPFSVSYTDMSANRVFHEVRGICLAAVLWPIASGTLMFQSGLKLTDHQALLGLLLVIPSGVLLVLIVGNLRLRADFEPIRRFLKAPAGEMDEMTGKDGLIAARNFQFLAVRRILLYQTPAFGIGFLTMIALCNLFLGMELGLWQLLIAMIVSLMVSIGHAVFEFYALSNLMNHIIALAVDRGVVLDEQEKAAIIRVDTKRKLLFVSGLVMIAPMVILCSTTLIRVHHDVTQAGIFDAHDMLMSELINWMLIIVSVSALLSLLISLRMASDTSNSVRELSGAMQRVEQGNLDISLLEKSSDEYAEVIGHFNRMVNQLKERERLRDAFGRYVSKDLTDEVMKHGINMNGQNLPVTIMFTDLRGFSAISESLPPEDVVGIINAYLDEMSQVIEHYSGTINELMGDGLLVVFGAPNPLEDAAARAAACALAMQLAIDKINARNEAKDLPKIEMGIGIHSGKVVAGNVGSTSRTKYAVVGNTVNIAARVESFSVGGQILATKETVELIRDDLKLAGEFTTHFKGISSPVSMCDIVGIAGNYNLSLPKSELEFARLVEALPVEFEKVLDKTAVGSTQAGNILAIADKNAILSTTAELELHTNLKIAVNTPLLPEDSRMYAKVMKDRGEHCYVINFTFMSRDARYFCSNLQTVAET